MDKRGQTGAVSAGTLVIVIGALLVGAAAAIVGIEIFGPTTPPEPVVDSLPEPPVMQTSSQIVCVPAPSGMQDEDAIKQIQKNRKILYRLDNNLLGKVDESTSHGQFVEVFEPRREETVKTNVNSFPF
ncbi:MAG: hypothetical protein AAFR26_17965, partial [Cyanobacteria bacterium J06626_4]